MLFKCPSCGKCNITGHIEYKNGIARMIYKCNDCYWSNRYTGTIYTINTTINTKSINGGRQYV